MSFIPVTTSSTYRYVSTGSSVPIITTAHYPVIYQRPLLGPSILTSSVSPPHSATTTKRTVTVSHGYGTPLHSTTVTSTGAHVPFYPATIPIQPPAWATTAGLLTSASSTSSVSKVRYEWRVDADGILRQIAIDESNPPASEPGSSQFSDSTLLTSTPRKPTIQPPSIHVTPVEATDLPPRQISVESISTDATGTDEGGKKAAAEFAEATRIARMRAAANMMMENAREAKLKKEEEKRIAELEAELASARAQNAVTGTLERQLEAMRNEMDAMRRQIGADAEAKRRQDEEERRGHMEREIEQLKKLEEEKRVLLEEELNKLRDAQQAQQFRTEKERELLELQQQQAVLTQTMRVEETAKTLTSAQLGPVGEFLAIDHPFKSVIIQLHDLRDLAQPAREILQRNGGVRCEITIGSHCLRADSRAANHGSQFRWEDLLTFPYLNERYVRITCFESSNGAVLCGVKFELEPFLLDPAQMCGRHELHVVDQYRQAVGILSITLHLSSEFIAKPFIALRSEPAPSRSSTAMPAFSSVVTPFQSVVLGLHSTANMTIPLTFGSSLICRVGFGQIVLSSGPLPASQEGVNWNVEYTLPLSGNREIVLEVFDQAMQALGCGRIDLDTLLMSGVAIHAISVALKGSVGDIIGNLCASLEFSTSPANPSVRESSSRASPNMGSQAIQSTKNDLVQSMLLAMGGKTLTPPMQSVYHEGGSLLADSGLGWGLLPMVPGTVSMFQPGNAEAAGALIPRPSNCKVQIHHLRNMARDLLREKMDPVIKVFILGEVAQTVRPKVTHDSVKWKEADACFNFKIDVDSMLAAARDNPSAAAMTIELHNQNKMIGVGEINLLPIVTVSSGYFAGDVQLLVGGTPIRSALANITVQTF